MAGIYVHIPFCRQACFYCNFHFSTSGKLKSELIDSILSEIKLQENYLGNDLIETIYFGGGTPSILKTSEIERILQTIYSTFTISNNPEITLEANPDDLSFEKLNELKNIGINRLSIGVQSFNYQLLKYLNRIHTGNDAIHCIDSARKIGFENINIDLIYNIVQDEHETIKKDLSIINKLQPEHISAYSLTIEPKTAFGVWKEKGKLKEINEGYASKQFELVISTLEQFGFQQYEVSNFARNELYSRHNTSYWQHINYLGVGPAAHSFNGMRRQFNMANNSQYIKSIAKNRIPFEMEILDNKTKANEMLMTGLRTIWGCDLKKLKSSLDLDLIKESENQIENLKDKKLIQIVGDKLLLTKKGLLLADEITAQLMWI